METLGNLFIDLRHESNGWKISSLQESLQIIAVGIIAAAGATTAISYGVELCTDRSADVRNQEFSTLRRL